MSNYLAPAKQPFWGFLGRSHLSEQDTCRAGVAATQTMIYALSNEPWRGGATRLRPEIDFVGEGVDVDPKTSPQFVTMHGHRSDVGKVGDSTACTAVPAPLVTRLSPEGAYPSCTHTVRYRRRPTQQVI